MKLASVFLGLIFIVTCCSQNKYEYKVESIILDCFYQHHTDNEIDIKSIIDNIEYLLIKHEFLYDNSGESFIRVIEQIRDNNDLIIINQELLTDIKSIEYIPSSVFCQDSIYISKLDSSAVINSKLKYILDIFDSVHEIGDISSSIIADKILLIFNASDFENDFYRTIGLIVFSNLIGKNDYENGLGRRLPPPLKEQPSVIEEHNILSIYINEENKALVNGEYIEVVELTKIVKKFILEISDRTEISLPHIGNQMTSKGIISLQNDKAASYEFYITVQNELQNAYYEIRNMYSQKFFNSTYNNLDIDRQKIIKDLVPQRISEAELRGN